MNIKEFDVIVTPREGENLTPKAAKLYCCPKCDDKPPYATLWALYTIDGHLHTQCAGCNETYCHGDGACALL